MARTSRPENSRPKMSNIERAKQFAPFAALGRLDEAFSYIEGQTNIGELERIPDLSDLSAEEAAEMLAKMEQE